MNTTPAAVSAAMATSVDPTVLPPAAAYTILGGVAVIVGMMVIFHKRNKKNERADTPDA